MQNLATNAHLFDQVMAAGDEDRIVILTRVDVLQPQVIQSEAQYVRDLVHVSDLVLNVSNQSLRVNFLQHFEYAPDSGDVGKRFSWVTDSFIDQIGFTMMNDI